MVTTVLAAVLAVVMVATAVATVVAVVGEVVVAVAKGPGPVVAGEAGARLARAGAGAWIGARAEERVVVGVGLKACGREVGSVEWAAVAPLLLDGRPRESWNVVAVRAEVVADHATTVATKKITTVISHVMVMSEKEIETETGTRKEVGKRSMKIGSETDAQAGSMANTAMD